VAPKLLASFQPRALQVTKRILLIDSDEAFAQGLSAAMNARGFAATMATNSEQGMTLARQESPDLIVVCVEAQPTNGYMLCTRLKKDEQLKGIPVILTSANATADSFEKHKKLKTRAEEYLIKPFEPQVMLERASALLGVSLPPEAPAGQDDEIVSIDDEPLGLGDLVSGEDEPIHLSEHEVAQAHAGLEDSVVVEEVEDLTEQPQDDSGDDDLKMFDQAFDSLGGPATAPSSHAGAAETERFAGLHAVPAPEDGTHAAGSYEEAAQPTELTAPDDEAVLHGLLHDEGGPQLQLQDEHAALDYEAHAALEARVAELEGLLASRDAELENARRSSASSGETLKLKEAKNRSDKELLRLKEELHAKETELLELQEQQTSLEGQAQQLKDDSVKREAAAKALQQRADALAAAAKKFERELMSSREELKQVAGLKGKTTELQAAHEALQKKHAEAEAEVEKHKSRAGDLETELAGARDLLGEQLLAAQAETEQVRRSHAAAQADADEAKKSTAAALADAEEAKQSHATALADLSKHSDDLQQARAELETTRHELEGARAELETSRHELEGVRAELETLRTDVAALTGEKDLLGEEREELRKQLEAAQSQAAQNEDRAVKAFQKIKSDEKLREKTRKALQIALQLLDEDATGADDSAHPEKQTA
jgi:DNA-binding response OmpR family regulator/outer membrane murein-binding lipoprotein Lpp